MVYKVFKFFMTTHRIADGRWKVQFTLARTVTCAFGNEHFGDFCEILGKYANITTL